MPRPLVRARLSLLQALLVTAFMFIAAAAPAGAGAAEVRFLDVGARSVTGQVVGRGPDFVRCTVGEYHYDVLLQTLGTAARQDFEQQEKSLPAPLPTVEAAWVRFTDATGAEKIARVFRHSPAGVLCFIGSTCHEVAQGSYQFVKPEDVAAHLSTRQQAVPQPPPVVRFVDGFEARPSAQREQEQEQERQRQEQLRLELEILREQNRRRELEQEREHQAQMVAAQRQAAQAARAAQAAAERTERELARQQEEARRAADQIAFNQRLIQQQLLENSPAYQCQLEAQRQEAERLREIQLSRIKHDPYGWTGR